MKKYKNPIHIKPKNKGKLHKKLGISSNKKIPEAELLHKIHLAKPGSALKKELVFAENARHWNHRK